MKTSKKLSRKYKKQFLKKNLSLLTTIFMISFYMPPALATTNGEGFCIPGTIGGEGACIPAVGVGSGQTTSQSSSGETGNQTSSDSPLTPPSNPATVPQVQGIKTTPVRFSAYGTGNVLDLNSEQLGFRNRSLIFGKLMPNEGAG